ncbi:MAG TPA: TlpA disulfide reductase family protein [Capsulimonadaceae bacterium]|nr:TlpA disulfide reductase family protein [Capsulimonadaceae bacterium]
MIARFIKSINYRLVLAIVVLLAALCFLAASVNHTQVNIDENRPFAIIASDKQSMAPDFTLMTSDGQKVTLSEAVKKGPVILDFWASWCGPCRMEMPELQTVYKKYQARGVQLYGVNSDDQAPAINEFLKDNHVVYPTLVDSDHHTHNVYGVNSIPLVLIVDGDMRVVAGSDGYDPDTKVDLSRTLDNVLNS